jgi:glycosyltransferase involved in cell wall biosynthesis
MQTYENSRIIIDDGSSDNCSFEVIDGFINRDAR